MGRHLELQLSLLPHRPGRVPRLPPVENVRRGKRFSIPPRLLRGSPCTELFAVCPPGGRQTPDATCADSECAIGLLNVIAEVLEHWPEEWIPVRYLAADDFDNAAGWLVWCSRYIVRVLGRKGLRVLFRGGDVQRLVGRAQRICLVAWRRATSSRSAREKMLRCLLRPAELQHQFELSVLGHVERRRLIHRPEPAGDPTSDGGGPQWESRA